MTYLRNLSPADLTKTYEAADYLCGLPVRLDPQLAIKLDTFRADLMAEIEDRVPAAPGGRPAVTDGAGQ